MLCHCFLQNKGRKNTAKAMRQLLTGGRIKNIDKRKGFV